MALKSWMINRVEPISPMFAYGLTFVSTSSAPIVLMTANAAAQLTGLPPNVDPWSPGGTTSLLHQPRYRPRAAFRPLAPLPASRRQEPLPERWT